MDENEVRWADLGGATGKNRQHQRWGEIGARWTVGWGCVDAKGVLQSGGLRVDSRWCLRELAAGRERRSARRTRIWSHRAVSEWRIWSNRAVSEWRRNPGDRRPAARRMWGRILVSGALLKQFGGISVHRGRGGGSR